MILELRQGQPTLTGKQLFTLKHSLILQVVNMQKFVFMKLINVTFLDSWWYCGARDCSLAVLLYTLYSVKCVLKYV